MAKIRVPIVLASEMRDDFVVQCQDLGIFRRLVIIHGRW